MKKYYTNELFLAYIVFLIISVVLLFSADYFGSELLFICFVISALITFVLIVLSVSEAMKETLNL